MHLGFGVPMAGDWATRRVRLDVGVGLGWSEDEYDAVNVPFRQLGKRGDEFLRCLKEIWT